MVWRSGSSCAVPPCGFVIRVMPFLSVPYRVAQFAFWRISLKIDSNSSLAVSADTCGAGANSGANLRCSTGVRAPLPQIEVGHANVSFAHVLLLSMMMRVKWMERLWAMLGWLAWRKLLGTVPRKLSHVNTIGAKSDSVPVPGSEQVPRVIDNAEPFLETELRAAVPLNERKLRPGPLAQAEALLSWLQKLHPPGALLRAADVEHECYPLFLEEKGWWPQPWGSRNGIGKHLRGLPGVGKVSPYIEAEDGIKERARCYRLPLADAVAEAADLAALKRAA